MVCVLDFKREAGLWHSILASVFNGMHVIFVPYALMKVNPASWMQMVTRHRATVAICKSRDLHWGLLATKDHRELNLSSLRMLLVADGANPWSLSSCDQFLSVFQVWPQTQFLFPLCKNSLICLEGKSMTPHRGNTILCSSSQELPRLRLRPLKGAMSARKAIWCPSRGPHLSKRLSDLKQNGTHCKGTIFWLSFQYPFIWCACFLASGSSKNHLLTGCNFLTAN